MPLPMVLATAVPKTKAAMKFQKAAQATARKGVSTRVETTVAMELAASCQPLENSKIKVKQMTATSREKGFTGGNPAKRGRERYRNRATKRRDARAQLSGVRTFAAWNFRRS